MYQSEQNLLKQKRAIFTILLLYTIQYFYSFQNSKYSLYISFKWFIHYNLYVKLRQKKAKRKRLILLVKNSYTVIRMQACLRIKSETEAEVYRFQTNLNRDNKKNLLFLKPLFTLFQISYLASGTSLQEIVSLCMSVCVCSPLRIHHMSCYLYDRLALSLDCPFEELWSVACLLFPLTTPQNPRLFLSLSVSLCFCSGFRSGLSWLVVIASPRVWTSSSKANALRESLSGRLVAGDQSLISALQTCIDEEGKVDWGNGLVFRIQCVFD